MGRRWRSSSATEKDGDNDDGGEDADDSADDADDNAGDAKDANNGADKDAGDDADAKEEEGGEGLHPRGSRDHLGPRGIRRREGESLRLAGEKI